MHGARGCPASGTSTSLRAPRALLRVWPSPACPPPRAPALPSPGFALPEPSAPQGWGPAGSRPQQRGLALRGQGRGRAAREKRPAGRGERAARPEPLRPDGSSPGDFPCAAGGGRGAWLSRLLRARASASGKPFPLRLWYLGAMAISSSFSLLARDRSRVESRVLNY